MQTTISNETSGPQTPIPNPCATASDGPCNNVEPNRVTSPSPEPWLHNLFWDTELHNLFGDTELYNYPGNPPFPRSHIDACLDVTGAMVPDDSTELETSFYDNPTVTYSGPALHQADQADQLQQPPQVLPPLRARQLLQHLYLLDHELPQLLQHLQSLHQKLRQLLQQLQSLY